ncbi:hypothetical protein QQP08_014655 [Theobroma cacao]|nr:hypothetical protein QQP08_014655 [Theobroma cacao]
MDSPKKKKRSKDIALKKTKEDRNVNGWRARGKDIIQWHMLWKNKMTVRFKFAGDGIPESYLIFGVRRKYNSHQSLIELDLSSPQYVPPLQSRYTGFEMAVYPANFEHNIKRLSSSKKPKDILIGTPKLAFVSSDTMRVLLISTKLRTSSLGQYYADDIELEGETCIICCLGSRRTLIQLKHNCLMEGNKVLRRLKLD